MVELQEQMLQNSSEGDTDVSVCCVGAMTAPDWIGFGFLLFESEYIAHSISEGIVKYFLRKLRISSKWSSKNFEYHTFL